MKTAIFAASFALLSLPAFAQSPANPDVVTLSRQAVESSAQACSELLQAFKSGDVLIKELRAENEEQRKLIALQITQISTLQTANAKLEQANESLRLANESLNKALTIANERHEKDTAALTVKAKASRRKRIVVAALKIAGIGGATVACGPYCGIAAAVGVEVLPIALRK